MTEYKVGDRVRATAAVLAIPHSQSIRNKPGLQPGNLGTVKGVQEKLVYVRWDGDPIATAAGTTEWAMLHSEIEPAHEAPTKYRKSIADEVLAYADSIDEYTTHDDIYAGLIDLASEIRKGDWG